MRLLRKLALGCLALLAVAAVALAAALLRPSVSARRHVTGTLFTDVTKRSGVTFRFRGDFMDGKFVPTMGGGAAVADFDGDGVLDIFFVQQVRSGNRFRERGRTQPLPDCSRLYRGRGDGTFEDVTERSGIRACGWGVSAMWADLDGDGFPDLLVGNAGDEPTLWQNKADGTFAEVKGFGKGRAGFTEGLAALDYDGDGIPDVYLGHYVDTDPDRESKHEPTKSFMTPDEYAGEDNTMLRGKGSFLFDDATDATGTRDPGSKTIGAVALDYDGDGFTDLYVSNDQWRNTLFHNEGNGTFRDVSDETGTGYPQDAITAFGRKTRSGMGLVAQDLDGDGRPDLFVTNYANEPNTLYRNVEGAMFEECDRQAFGGADPSIPLSGWGVVALDYDDDGREDLAVTNGQILPRWMTWIAKKFNPQAKNFDVGEPSYAQRQFLFHNESAPGAPRFRDVSAEAGDLGRVVVVGRGLAAGDLDGDGKLDLVYNPIDAPAIVLKNTSGGTNRSLEVLPVAGADRRTVLGTRVTVDGRTKSFHVVPSLASGSWEPLHFGLGERREARVTVTWPDGTVQDLGALAAGAYRVRRGESARALRAR